MKFTSMGLSEDLINTMEAVLAMEGDYEEFFQKALKKFGVDSPADFKSETVYPAVFNCKALKPAFFKFSSGVKVIILLFIYNVIS